MPSQHTESDSRLHAEPHDAGIEDTQPHVGVSASLHAISRNGQFWTHSLSYALLAGISFAIPAISANAFAGCMHPSLSYVSRQSMWINFFFIFLGFYIVGKEDYQAINAEQIKLYATELDQIVGIKDIGSSVL